MVCLLQHTLKPFGNLLFISYDMIDDAYYGTPLDQLMDLLRGTCNGKR
jgi:hypothetical protein